MMISRPVQGSNNVSVPSSEAQPAETAVKEQGTTAPKLNAEDKFEAQANQIGSFYDLLISSYNAPAKPKVPDRVNHLELENTLISNYSAEPKKPETE